MCAQFPPVGLLLLLLGFASPPAASFTVFHPSGLSEPTESKLLVPAEPEENSTLPWAKARATSSAAADPEPVPSAVVPALRRAAGSEPWRTPADLSGASESGRTAAVSEPGGPEQSSTTAHVSEPSSTAAHSPSGSGSWRRLTTQSGSEPRRAAAHPSRRAATPPVDGLNLERTEQTPGGSEPVSTAVLPLGRTETGRTAAQTPDGSELGRTAIHTPSGSESTRTNELKPGTSEPGRTAAPSEVGWTERQTPGESDLLWTGAETSRQSAGAREPAIGSSYQLVNRRDTEKRSAYHTDRTYVSTTFTRGGNRTLLSVTNSSALENVTSNISNFPISTDSFAVAQTVGQNVSKRNINPAASSTDPLITDSSKVLLFFSSKNDSSSYTSESTSSLFHETAGPAANTTASFTTLDSTSNSRSASLDALQSSSSSQSLLSTYFTSSSDSPGPSNTSVLNSDSFSFLSSSLLPEIFSSSPSAPSSLLPSSVESSSSSSWLPSSSTSELTISSSSPMLPFPSTLMPPSFSELPFSSTPSSLTPVSSTSLSPSPLWTLFSSSTSLLPSSASLPVDDFQTNGSVVTSELPEQTVTMESSTALFYGEPMTGNVTHGDPYQTRENASTKSTVMSFFQPDPTQLLDSSSSNSASSNITEGFAKGDLTPKDDSFIEIIPFSSTTETRFSQRTQEPKTIEEATNTVPHATTLLDSITTDEDIAKETTQNTQRTSSLTTDYSTAFKTSWSQIDTVTKINYITISTPDVEINTAASTKVTEQNVPAKTTETFTTVSAVSIKATTVAQSISTRTSMTSTSHTTVGVCSPNPCLHQGACVVDHISGTYRCECTSSWKGRLCGTDMDECLSNPCHSQALCINSQGSFTCSCPLGYELLKGTECSLVRTFIGQIIASRDLLNSTSGKYSELHQIEGEVIQMLNASLLMLDGYYRSAVIETQETKYISISVQNLFSAESSVATSDVLNSVKSHIKSCKAANENSESCQLLKHVHFIYQAGSLCSLQYPECDNDTSECSDAYGIAQCQCKMGYFKYNKLDHSCRACEDGYKRENGTCVKCSFGFGGFNCSNPYQLITVVIAAAGGGLLLILGTALAVTCCRKSKNDISKLIFKSGDFQMSPYTEYPKNPRSSQWGRETIEMQENGSTKNLLQMTDVYYSPALRNPEVDRNGLYPYIGLPGSRHSYIYPGQYNPSFISDESRRRDYF